MRLVVNHPAERSLVAACGHNRTRIGWWAEVRRAGKLVEAYDGLVTGTETTLEGALRVLIQHGFLAEQDVADAYRWMPVVDCVGDIEETGTRRAAQLIERLKRAASAD